MPFRNVYDDAARAEAYSRVEFPGTYYLAYRDLPAILAEHVDGLRAVDFGCGAGRSTRFLRRLGFQVVGLDISAEMIRKAREIDPSGDYRLVAAAGAPGLPAGAWDLVLSAFTFDNVPQDAKPGLLRALAGLLAPGGRLVNLVSTPEIYVHEWASFSTRDFPANRDARNGDVVRIVMTDVPDRRPVEDVVCTKAAYLDLYRDSGLAVVASREPLGNEDEPFAWVTEASVPPWRVDVLRRQTAPHPAAGG
ncbi:MAG TPA: methyltransferase domain-containing protein [Vicinamibacteria bacterium]|nr:methyltransferase domain-containing protein [Vicinamibacteria bacterium]